MLDMLHNRVHLRKLQHQASQTAFTDGIYPHICKLLILASVYHISKPEPHSGVVLSKQQLADIGVGGDDCHWQLLSV